MCTVTVVPTAEGFRLRCNRDERRDRPAALPPSIHALTHGEAIYPIDPIGPGTWVGVNDAGVCMALLNRNATPAARFDRPQRLSRGVMIPNLLDARSWEEALERCLRIEIRAFNPFRLVIVQAAKSALVTSDGTSIAIDMRHLSEPLMCTSSSLGDPVVEGPRRRLFVRLFTGDRSSWPAAQRRFHTHRWRFGSELSVNMERPDARTVSQTTIDVDAGRIRLRYRATGSDRPCAVTVKRS